MIDLFDPPDAQPAAAAAPPPTVAVQAAEDDDDDDLCVICWENPINTVILECGHRALCLDCSEGLRMYLLSIDMCLLTRSRMSYVQEAGCKGYPRL